MKKMAVIGIGRLGLCFALNLEKVGYEVLGIDVHEGYVKRLQSKDFESPEPFVSQYLKESSHFHATTDFSMLNNPELALLFILVPTPSLPDSGFSHAYIDAVANELEKLPLPAKPVHLVIGSTVMPGYSDQLAQRLKPFGYTVTYNPEFIAQGSIIRDQQQPDQILIGEGDPEATELLKEVYARICVSNPGIHVMNRKSAEICKLATNCFLTMKISFANAIGDLAETTGAEPDKILAAIGSDTRIGEKYLRYGFGFGGPCFPRDNQALNKFARESGIPLKLSEATVAVNKEHLDFQFRKYMAENSDTIVLDYLTYKKGTDILEESQQLQLALMLVSAGKKVCIKESSHIRQKLETDYPGLFEFLD